ncbi:MAG: lipoprotein [Gammaproteobacteria bacterium]|nr:lipoprotein [Gammaproteobacteria bacterium]
MYKLISISLILLTLLACGQRGPLYLPDSPNRSADPNVSTLY